MRRQYRLLEAGSRSQQYFHETKDLGTCDESGYSVGGQLMIVVVSLTTVNVMIMHVVRD